MRVVSTHRTKDGWIATVSMTPAELEGVIESREPTPADMAALADAAQRCRDGDRRDGR